MPVSLDFLRGMLGVLCIFFAHMAGRSAEAVRKGRQKVSRLYGWLIRTFVCAVILIFRHTVDNVALGVWTLSAVAFAVGMWTVSRQKPPEDLTHEIFPQ
jgi:uncharacterized membrane protein